MTGESSVSSGEQVCASSGSVEEVCGEVPTRLSPPVYNTTQNDVLMADCKQEMKDVTNIECELFTDTKQDITSEFPDCIKSESNEYNSLMSVKLENAYLYDNCSGEQMCANSGSVEKVFGEVPTRLSPPVHNTTQNDVLMADCKQEMKDVTNIECELFTDTKQDITSEFPDCIKSESNEYNSLMSVKLENAYLYDNCSGEQMCANSGSVEKVFGEVPTRLSPPVHNTTQNDVLMADCKQEMKDVTNIECELFTDTKQDITSEFPDCIKSESNEYNSLMSVKLENTYLYDNCSGEQMCASSGSVEEVGVGVPTRLSPPVQNTTHDDVLMADCKQEMEDVTNISKQDITSEFPDCIKSESNEYNSLMSVKLENPYLYDNVCDWKILSDWKLSVQPYVMLCSADCRR